MTSKHSKRVSSFRVGFTRSSWWTRSLLVVVLLAFVLIFPQLGAAGPTFVSGVIPSSTWTPAGSPYVIIGDVIVPPAATLIIMPGVEVRFALSDNQAGGTDPTKTELIIQGRLDAVGTATQKIVFTAHTASPLGAAWGEIGLYSSNNTIAYAEIKYATYGVYIHGSPGTPLTNNDVISSTFRHCGDDTLVSDGPPCVGGGVDEIGGAIRGEYAQYSEFAGLEIRDSERGIWLEHADNNVIRDSTFYNLQQSAIRLSGDSDNNEVRDNTIRNVSDYGLVCWGASGAFGDNNVISGNTIHDTWDAGLVFYYQNNGQIENNTIYRTAYNPNNRTCNGAGYSMTLHGGIWLSATTGSAVRQNSIYNNGNQEWAIAASGVYISDGAAGNLLEENAIYDNQGNGVTIVGANTDRNTLSANRIYRNKRLGIDLGDDGVTPNDPGDWDTGPNEQLNFPVIEYVAYLGHDQYEARGTAPANAIVELFETDLDIAQYGEATNFVARTTADIHGKWSAIFTLEDAILGSATATDPAGNTSEFSHNKIMAGRIWVDDDWRGLSFGDSVGVYGLYGVSAFSTIQSGVDAVAISGTVYIRPGVYREQVVIEKSGITLEGANRELVTLRDGGLSSYGTIHASGVQNAAIAINPDKAEAGHPVGITIRGMTIERADAGIYMPRFAESYLIEDCIIQRSLYGILIERDAISVTIANNILRDNEYAIAAGIHYANVYTYTHVHGLVISGNQILDGDHRLDLQGETAGILIWEADCEEPSSNILIEYNEISDQSFGIWLAGVHNAVVRRNNITDIPYQITESNFAENGYGIFLYGWSGNNTCDAEGAHTEDVLVVTNTVKHCYKGLVIKGADGVEGYGNAIMANTNDGVEVSASNNEHVRWLSAPATPIYAEEINLYANAICGNGAYQLDHTQSVLNAGQVEAVCNWWGTNTPGASDINNATNVDYTPWMTMTIAAVPPAVSGSGTSTSLIYVTYGCGSRKIPDGHIVFWDTSLGILTPPVSVTRDGRAWTELRSFETGLAVITATDECGEVVTIAVPAQGYRPDFEIIETDTVVQAHADEILRFKEYAGDTDTAVVTITLPFRFDFNLKLPVGTHIGSGSMQMLSTPPKTCPIDLVVAEVLTREFPIGSGTVYTYSAHWLMDIDQSCTSVRDWDIWITGSKEEGWTFLFIPQPDPDYVMTATVSTTLTINGMIGATPVITNPSCATSYPVGVFFRSELDQIVCRSTSVEKVPTSVWWIEKYPVSMRVQRGPVNTTLPEPFVAWVHDDSWCNNSIEGVPVLWDFIQVPEGATGHRINVHRPYTDASGRALAWVTLGDKIGQYVIRARSPQARGEVYFSAYASQEGCIVSVVSYSIDDTWVSDGEGNHHNTRFLRLGDGRYDVGLRFRAPGVPQGSQILSAKLRFTPYIRANAQITMTIYAEATDYASAFLATNRLVPLRPRTSAYVTWPITCTHWDTWARVDSPDIAPVIQEIVNRPGWVEHNALAILLIADRRDRGKGYREVWAYDGAAAENSIWDAVELEICYIPPWAITPSPTPTPSDTPTPTDTPTSTWTPTPSPTATGTPIATYTRTPSPSVTPTPTVTATETRTPKPTATGTVTPTGTRTPKPEPTPTVTATDTRVPTWTPSPTATLTPTETPVLVGTIQGIVWEDLDEDGEREIGEPPLGGVQIILRDAGGQQLDSDTTDSFGFYSFPNLLPGRYIVQEIDPPGYFSTTPNVVQVDVVAGAVVSVDFGDKHEETAGGPWPTIYLPSVLR